MNQLNSLIRWDMNWIVIDCIFGGFGWFGSGWFLWIASSLLPVLLYLFFWNGVEIEASISIGAASFVSEVDASPSSIVVGDVPFLTDLFIRMCKSALIHNKNIQFERKGNNLSPSDICISKIKNFLLRFYIWLGSQEFFVISFKG